MSDTRYLRALENEDTKMKNLLAEATLDSPKGDKSI